MVDFFAYGQVVPPEVRYGVLQRGGYLVSKAELKRIQKYHSRVRHLTWDFCTAQRRTCHRRMTLKALRWDGFGWRVRSFDEYTDKINDLCRAFTTDAVVFPSASAAIAAAEIFSCGQHWKVAQFVWVDGDNEWRFLKSGILMPKRRSCSSNVQACLWNSRRRVRRRLAASSSEKQRIAPNAPM